MHVCVCVFVCVCVHICMRECTLICICHQGPPKPSSKNVYISNIPAQHVFVYQVLSLSLSPLSLSPPLCACIDIRMWVCMHDKRWYTTTHKQASTHARTHTHTRASDSAAQELALLDKHYHTLLYNTYIYLAICLMSSNLPHPTTSFRHYHQDPPGTR